MARPVLALSLALGVAALSLPSFAGKDAGSPLVPTWSCTYDFEVTLTQGPSAPWALNGQLTLVTQDDREFVGTLRPAGGGANVRVRGETVLGEGGGRIALTLQLPDGGRVLGMGPVASGVRSCAAGQTIEGVAFGPGVAADYAVSGTDAGHWLATTLTLSDVQVVEAVILDPGSLTLTPTTTTGSTGGTRAATGDEVELEPGSISRRDCTACGGTIKSTKKGDACVYDRSDSGVAMCIDGARRLPQTQNTAF